MCTFADLLVTYVASCVTVCVGVLGYTALSCAYVTILVAVVVIRVIEHGNGLLLYGYRAADRAMLAFGQAALGTRRRYCRIGYLGVSKCRNGLLRYGYRAAYGTVLTVAYTVIGTGGCCTRINNLGVSERGNYLG